jgi:hypothetical protein
LVRDVAPYEAMKLRCALMRMARKNSEAKTAGPSPPGFGIC